MYNESRKQRFIDFIKASKSGEYGLRELHGTFDKSAQYENILNKDISHMNREEAVAVIREVLSSIHTLKVTRFNILRDYAMWSISIGDEKANDAILKLRPCDVCDYPETMFKSPADLQSSLDGVFDNEDENSMDNAYRCFHWLAYSGFPREELGKIRTIDVDLKKRKIKYGYKDMPIYDEAYKSFEKMVTLESFKYIHPHYEATYRPRVTSDKLMRGIKSEYMPRSYATACAVKFKRAKDAGRAKKDLIYLKIARSGFFYRVLDMEQTAGVVDFYSAVIEDNLFENSVQDIRTDISVKYKVNLLQDHYLWWKMVFNLK